MYELWATQGQGPVFCESFPTLEQALSHVEEGASFGIKYPNGTWHKWPEREKGNPCTHCAARTVYLCSDCMIEKRQMVYICLKTPCYEAHQKANPEHPVGV